MEACNAVENMHDGGGGWGGASLRFKLRGCGGCSCCCGGGGCNVVLDADVTAAEEAMMDATQQLQRRCGEGCCDGVAAAAAAMRPCCSSARCARARRYFLGVIRSAVFEVAVGSFLVILLFDSGGSATP